ncbi:MAG TPA: F420H(2):quinone oxidoreductase [Stenotrophomonas sp.]|nr:F420H(2):quinone oxidoreductase [Stenotrophomonas sp.]
MPLRAIAYTSVASEGIQGSDIDRILQAASSFNKVAGVTGVLMFDGTRFLQYFEGPEDGVDSVYQRVVNARSHLCLRELARGWVTARHFPRWTMASAAIEPAVLTRMVERPWEGFSAAGLVPGQADVGFAQLLQLWTGDSGEREPAAVMLGS